MEDMLEDRRRTGDWWWVLRNFRCPLYKHGKSRMPNELKQDVLNSRPVQHAISQLITELGKSKDELMQEAYIILEGMGHNFNMASIRVCGLILSKSWKKLYQGIYVDTESLEQVRRLIPDFPVILMPTHRSYIDFLAMSYCFYHFNLPLPVIAGGQDFMSMNIVGTLLRNAGAFFIRRSFGKDKLYWAIFSEYVRSIMVNGDAPMEFFVEGTRSRSAKSLPPKYGMLTAAVEPFFKADVPDIYIVPVSITYDRTLEEELYAYEMLGVPKPKESTTGLLKARKIFNNDYGNFYIKFATPMSVRSFCGHQIDRSIHNFCRHLSPLTAEEHRVVEEMAHVVVKSQQKNLILPPFVFIATILVHYMQQSQLEIEISHLLDEVKWFLTLLVGHGPFTMSNQVSELMSAGNDEAIKIIKAVCKTHSNVIKINKDLIQIIELQPNLTPSAYKQYGLSKEVLKRSVTQILLSHYSNQVLHLLVPEGLITLILKSNPDAINTQDELFSEYQFLGTVLQLEFIMAKGADSTLQEFKAALSFLISIDAVHVDDESLSHVLHCRVNHFLFQMFEPFLVAYNIVCQVLLDSSRLKTPATVKEIAKCVQAEAESLMLKENVNQSIILSVDVINNAVGSLTLMRALNKENGNGVARYIPCYSELLSLTKRLAQYSRWSGTSYLTNLWVDTRAKL